MCRPVQHLKPNGTEIGLSTLRVLSLAATVWKVWSTVTLEGRVKPNKLILSNHFYCDEIFPSVHRTG